jgi:hypothetical protein
MIVILFSFFSDVWFGVSCLFSSRPGAEVGKGPLDRYIPNPGWWRGSLEKRVGLLTIKL